MAFKIKRQRKFHAHSRRHRRLLIFSIFFGVTGGIFLIISTRAAIKYVPYPPDRSICVENTPSKTAVKPGENFSAVVKLKNDGTSTWSPTYGYFLSEFRDGTTIWSPSGNTFTGTVAPQATKQFNLSVKAPTTPGPYTFNWGMAIVYKGFLQNPCLGKTVTVMNPPVVNLQVNGQNGNITLTKGNTLTLNWLAGSNITSCIASGNWSGSRAYIGSENRTADMATAGTKTYTINCSNAVGSASISRTVTVNNPPATSGSGSTSTGTTTGGSTTPTGRSSTPRSTPAPATSTADTAAPSIPADFVAEAMPDATVQLRWTASTDNTGVKGYQVDRSTDQTNWQNITGSELLDEESFSDTDVIYQTKYFYRVRAGDETGNFSDYASAEVTTSPFESNTNMDKDTTLSSEDGLVTVVIPAGAAGIAHCSLRVNNSILPPQKDGYETLAGPYQVFCKNSEGTIITAFNTPVTISITLNEQQKQDHEVLSYMTYKENEWKEVDSSPTEAIKSFDIADNSSFAILTDANSTPLWKKILFVLGFIGLSVGGVLLAVNFYLRFKQKRAIEQQYQDYYHKERGY